jgi:hypothetical protein
MTIPGFGRLTPVQIFMLQLAGVNLDLRRHGFDPMRPGAQKMPDERRIQMMKRGRRSLVALTGQDFGFDLAAWQRYLKARRDSGYTHPYGSGITRAFVQRHTADPERQRLVALIEANAPTVTTAVPPKPARPKKAGPPKPARPKKAGPPKQRKSNAESQYDSVVSIAWCLSRRPRLYTPTGSPTEVVAYLAGMLESLGPSFGDRATLDVAQRFAEWLAARHGGDDPDALSNAARICSTLSKAFSDPIDAMWHELEAFADEILSVPKGTYPIKLAPDGYAHCLFGDARDELQPAQEHRAPEQPAKTAKRSRRPTPPNEAMQPARTLRSGARLRTRG